MEWPKTIMEQPLIPVGDPEVKKDPLVNAFVSHRPLNATKVFLSYFSDFKKLRTSVAWMLRLRDVLLILSQRRKVLEISGIIGHDNGGRRKDYLYAEMQREKLALHRQSLTTGDLERAEGAIICFCQQERFSVKINSDLYKLHPMLEDGLLLVGGRLSRAAMPEVEKHPVLLSKEQHVSKLLLKHIHQQLGHAGGNHMLSSLRKQYWITHANSACRKVISECVVCRRFQGKTGVQKMADLPVERIEGWERLIHLAKRVLSSTLRLQTLDDEGFHTILCEVEAILNSRPITKVSDDANDLKALTPNRILLLKSKLHLNPGLFCRDDLYMKRRWRQVLFLSDLFWKRWLREYLPLLQETEVDETKKKLFYWRHCGHNGYCHSTRVLVSDGNNDVINKRSY